MADLKVMLEAAKESMLRTVAETAERNPGMTQDKRGGRHRQRHSRDLDVRPRPGEQGRVLHEQGQGQRDPAGCEGAEIQHGECPDHIQQREGGKKLQDRLAGEHDLNADDVAQKDKDVQKNGGGTGVTMLNKIKLMLRTELEKGPRLAQHMYRMGEAEWGEESGKTLKRAQLAIGGLTTRTKPYYRYLPGHEPVAVTPMPEVNMDDVEAI